MGSRRLLKEKVLELLGSRDLDAALRELCRLPARNVINPLFSFLLNPDPRIKWAAVTAMGGVVAELAARDMEASRVIMRRLMWQLNDESGGIGWGCPESMGEIMARHEGLAREYIQVLISYVRKDGNFLEYEPLQQGALWGIARVGRVRPLLAEGAHPYLLPFLGSQDTTLRGLASWALAPIARKETSPKLEALTTDRGEFVLYKDQEIKVCRVMDIASDALARIREKS